MQRWKANTIFIGMTGFLNTVGISVCANCTFYAKHFVSIAGGSEENVAKMEGSVIET